MAVVGSGLESLIIKKSKKAKTPAKKVSRKLKIVRKSPSKSDKNEIQIILERMKQKKLLRERENAINNEKNIPEKTLKSGPKNSQKILNTENKICKMDRKTVMGVEDRNNTTEKVIEHLGCKPKIKKKIICRSS